MTRPRPADLVRLVLGAVTLARPAAVLRLTGAPGDGPERTVARLLGGRYVVQGAAGVVADRPWPATADAAVDAVHAMSMLAAAAVWPRHRRAALTSAGVAAVLACADVAGRGR